MLNKNNKKLSLTSYFYKKTKIFICILVSLSILFGIFPSVVSSIQVENSFLNKNNGITESSKKIKDSKISEKIENGKTRLKENFVCLKDNPVLRFLRTYLSLGSTSSSLYFYTNYNGNEKRTEINMFQSLRVDVNDDGVKDINAQLLIFPSFDSSFSLSINSRLKINILNLPNSFPDKKAFFEGYIELEFPGFLNDEWREDRVRFGYKSSEDEVVPDDCTVTYKFLPHLLDSNKKPEHKVELNQGSIAGSSSLFMVFKYEHVVDTLVEDSNSWEIKYNPSVKKTEISLLRNNKNVGFNFNIDLFGDKSLVDIYYIKEKMGESSEVGLIIDKLSSFSYTLKLTPLSKGGGKIEYERVSSDPVDITLYKRDIQGFYSFVKDLPKHIVLSWLPERVGGIELNCFGDEVSAVGVRDSLLDSDATFKAFVANIPSVAKINWSIRPISDRNISVSLYTNISTCIGYIYSKDLMATGVTLEAEIRSNSNIDFSFYWDFSKHILRLTRSTNNIQIYVNAFNSNGNTFDFSGTIETIVDDFFEIDFGPLFNQKTEICLRGGSLDIRYVSAELYLVEYGTFYIEIDRLIKDRHGSILTTFNLFKDGGIYRFNCTVEIYRGIQIYGFVIGWDDFSYPVGDIIETKDYAIHRFGLTLEDANVEWDIAPDFSWGNIYISGGISLAFDSEYTRAGKLHAFVKGNVYFESDGDGLIISWRKVGNDTQVFIDGTAVLGLSGFELWVNESIHVEIPEIYGKFKINTSSKDWSVYLYVEDGSALFDLDLGRLSLINIKNITIQVSIDVYLNGGLSGYLMLSGNDSGVLAVDGFFDANVEAIVDITNLYFSAYNLDAIGGSLSVRVDEITIQGKVDFNINLTDESITLDSFYASLFVRDFEFRSMSSTLGFMVIQFYILEIEGGGTLTITNDTIDLFIAEFSILLKGLIADIDNLGYISCDEIYLELSDIKPGKTTIINGRSYIKTWHEATLEKFYIHDLLMKLPGQEESMAIHLEMSLGISGPILIQTDFGLGDPNTPDPDEWSVIRLEMDQYCTFSISDFYLNLNYGEIVIQWDNFAVQGKGVIYFHDNGWGDPLTPDNLPLLHVDGEIKSVIMLGFFAQVKTNSQDKSMRISGEFDFRFSGPLEIEFRIAGTTEHPAILVVLGLDSGSIDISNVQVKVSSKDNSDGTKAIASAGWDSLHIGVRAKGRFELRHIKGPSGHSSFHELYATASLDELILDNLWVKGSQGKKFVISGSFNLDFAGPFTVTVEKSTFSPWHLNFLLSSGRLTISDLVVDYNYGEVHGSWDTLTLDGDFEVDVIASSSDTSSSMMINADGSGSITLEMMRITSNAELVDAGVDLLSMDINAEASVNIQKQGEEQADFTVKATGSVSNIVIDNFYAEFSLVIPGGGESDLLVIEDADIQFSGTGEFNADIDYPGSISLRGGISGPNARVIVGYLSIFIPGYLQIDLDDFNLIGQTDFSIDAIGVFNQDQSVDFDVRVDLGSDSAQWSIGLFDFYFPISGLLQIFSMEDVQGTGTITFGVKGEVIGGEDGGWAADLIIGLDGDYSWANLNILPELLGTCSVPGGQFSGHAEIYLDLYALLIFDFQPLHLGGTVYETTTINFFKINLNLGSFSLSDVTLQRGDFDILFDGPFINNLIYPENNEPTKGSLTIDCSGTVHPNIGLLKININSGNSFSFVDFHGTFPYLRLEWNLDRSGTEEIKIDTNNETCIIDGYIGGIIHFNGLSLTADDFHVWWDYNSDKPFKDLEWDGTIDVSIGIIRIKIDGRWQELDWQNTGSEEDIVVDHGGPYECEAGEILTLSGFVSGGTSPYEYTWLIEDTVNGDQLLYGQTVNYDGFSEIGTYNIFLNVEDSDGDSAYVETTVNVVMPHENQPPKAILDAMEYHGSNGISIYFDGSDSYDPDGNITKWRWEYGDGTAEESSNMPTTNHVYDTPGAYDLKLWVYDDWQVRRSDTATVFIEDSANQPPEAYIYIYNKDTGSFVGPWDPSENSNSNAYGGVVEQLYTFKATKPYSHPGWGTTNDPDGSIYQYKWEIYNAVCFSGDTKITMADGSFKKIQEINIGDMVKTFDEENKVVKSSKVTNIYHHSPEEMEEYYLKINDELRVTTDHVIYINGQWKSAGNIKIGDTLVDINGEKITVTSIEKIFEKIKTFNIDVENYHTFYADNVLVHNEKDVPVTMWRTGFPDPIDLKRKSAGTITAILHVRDNEGAESQATVYFSVDDEDSNT